MKIRAPKAALTAAPFLVVALSCSIRKDPHGALAAGGAAGDGGGGADSASASGSGGSSSTEAGGGGDSSASSASSSSAPSSGSGPAECASPVDCPGIDTECLKRSCTGGKCGFFYPSNVPTAAQTEGDCALTVCDGMGGTKQLYDSADAVQVPGDCSTTVCVGIGQTTQQSTAADVPAGSSECSAGACSSGGPSQQPVADGTKCSTGLCKAGACVKFIPVCCALGGSLGYCGCDGNPNPAPQISIYWTDMAGIFHGCSGLDSSTADYCKPGTSCTVDAFGTISHGVCK